MVLVLLVTLFVSHVFGQAPIPVKPSGYTYRNGKATAGVQIDMFIDLVSLRMHRLLVVQKRLHSRRLVAIYSSVRIVKLQIRC